MPGAVDVVADPIRGKPYIEIRLDRERAARLGVSAGDVNELIETALAGTGRHADGRGPRAAPRGRALSRARCREDEESIREPAGHGPRRVAGAGLAGTAPAVRCRSPRSPTSRSSKAPRRSRAKTGCCATTSGSTSADRDAVDLVEEARAAVAREAKLPDGVFLEWTGQFEHAAPRAADA